MRECTRPRPIKRSALIAQTRFKLIRAKNGHLRVVMDHIKDTPAQLTSSTTKTLGKSGLLRSKWCFWALVPAWGRRQVFKCEIPTSFTTFSSSLDSNNNQANSVDRFIKHRSLQHGWSNYSVNSLVQVSKVTGIVWIKKKKHFRCKCAHLVRELWVSSNTECKNSNYYLSESALNKICDFLWKVSFSKSDHQFILSFIL